MDFNGFSVSLLVHSWRAQGFLSLGDVEVPLKPVGAHVVFFFVYRLPPYVTEEALVQVLAQNGEVKAINHARYETSRTSGSAPGCQCGLEGHIGPACKTPRCDRCGVFGHVTAGCTAPCQRCGHGHVTTDCVQLAQRLRDQPVDDPEVLQCLRATRAGGDGPSAWDSRSRIADHLGQAPSTSVGVPRLREAKHRPILEDTATTFCGVPRTPRDTIALLPCARGAGPYEVDSAAWKATGDNNRNPQAPDSVQLADHPATQVTDCSTRTTDLVPSDSLTIRPPC
ncbi:hypothetical protein HPB47_024731 [Ixodes persulcatus]|uniref:Uncharacterized protein n=1 Tax=Ixodes persulcatus TaxID=34615 RepID=A0AC60Q4Q9_IXOPE|nr:hypothetical protein HPB47_024731 [Ixodes persulcatus]